MHVHSSLRLSFFEFLSLNDTVYVSPKVPMRIIEIDGHRKAKVSTQLCSIQPNLSYFDADLSVVDHFCYFFSLHFTQLDLLTYTFRTRV